MPAPAVKADFPPEELTDRSEGWGTFGRIHKYPAYGDDGEYPESPTHLREFNTEQPETSHGNWYRDGELIES